ncbi:MAG: phosphonate ABC transporter, permease protein PhnE [Spirochaetales bacterium]|nr:phosphonate ABC transporter, permease protein PhnE [Spirochaetales bacterium]
MGNPQNNTDIKSKIKTFETSLNREIQEKSRKTVLGIIIFLTLFILSSIIGRFNISNLIEFPNIFNYIKKTLPVLRLQFLGYDLGVWYSSRNLYLREMFDTILIAYAATLLGTFFAFLLCFPASKNLMKNWWLYIIARRLLDFSRGVPELIYAMLFVVSFGIGPLPGVIAIAVHSVGSLGKLFSEVNENIDNEAIEGIRSTGGNWFQIIRYAVVPQVLPNYFSYALLRLEINIRASTIIGFVGAGGIGQQLILAVRQFRYQDVSAICLIIIACVMIMDFFCEKIRHNIIGRENLR